jgi:hypothetical protein
VLVAATVLALASVPLLATGAAAANPPDPAAPFNQCPAVGNAHGCAVLIVLEPDGSVHLLGDTGSGNPYDGADDTTIGVLNLSGADISTITLSSSKDIMGFDGDGICSGLYSGTPVGCPFDSTKYAGPGITFTGINATNTSGVVNFAQSCTGNTAASCTSTPGGLRSGDSAFFSLEEALDAASFVIPKADPVIASTTASPSVPVGGSISDSAVLANGRVPGGTLTFQLFGPGDTGCGTPLATRAVTVSGNGTYSSPAVTATVPGTYLWRVSYSGDANNNPAPATACGSESVVVTKASPTIATVPSGTVPVGGTISDTATIAGGSAPTGTVKFTLFGPGDTTCHTPISTLTATVAGNGSYASGPVVTSAPGTYNWTAAYSGDAANNAVSAGCGSETVTVTKATPTITTTPSASVPAGGKISDTATIAGGFAPTGTVTFTLFGAGDTTCHTPISTLTATVNGNGNYGSGTFTAAVAGTYRWIAAYSGDANNNAVGPTGCGVETVVVTPQTMTGHAFGLSANASTLGIPLVNLAPTPDTGPVSTTTAGTTAPPCVVTLTGLVSASDICAKVVTSLLPSSSTATASITSTTVGVGALPVIKVGAVQSQSTTSCAGSAGTTTIAYLSVGGVVVIAQPTPIAPNTKISVAGVSLVLNEQTPVPGGLTVNAVHVSVTGVVTLNVVLASATSDIHNCP